MNRSPNQPTTKAFIVANTSPCGLCWNWERARNKSGYGLVWHDGKTRLVHRVSFELWNGQIPKGICVCHECDNPSCVNPDHLFLGTDYDNKMDAVIKGRNRWPIIKGTEHPNAKLSSRQIKAIRASKIGARKLAPKFGVSATTIKYIKNGRRYASVDSI